MVIGECIHKTMVTINNNDMSNSSSISTIMYINQDRLICSSYDNCYSDDDDDGDDVTNNN